MWKCSNCGTNNEHNFCGQCRMPRAENDVWQFVAEKEAAQSLVPEQREDQSPMPEQEAHQQPPSEQAARQQSPPEQAARQQPPSEQEAQQQPPPEQAARQQPPPEQEAHQQPPPEQVARQQPPPEQATRQQPASDQVAHQQPAPEQANQYQPGADEKSGKKGLVVGIVVVVAIIALLTGLVIFAMRLILDERDPSSDTYVEEHEVEEVLDDAWHDEDEPAMDGISGPYHLDVWGESNVIELENNSITLSVPLPPETIMENVEIKGSGSALALGQGEGTQWFHVWIELGNRQLEDDFGEYSDYEVSRAKRSHSNFGEILDYQVYQERNATLLTIHWEDEYGEGISFVKISEIHGYLLVTEIGFESLENREEFFEAYGFNDHFESTIQEVVAQWGADGADSSNQEEDEDRNGEEVWTDEQMLSWMDLTTELWEISELSFDLYFFVWDYVIIENTIHEQYPNADVERLTRLHTEFADRFDELNAVLIADYTLSYDSEYNQNIFQQVRGLILEHESFYNDFRAALEGR